jgi:serine/threonine protein kinase
MEGGKKYGKGAKGYVIDLQQNNDDDYFLTSDTNDKNDTKYKIIYETKTKKEPLEEPLEEPLDDIKHLITDKSPTLIKVYTKEEYYAAELKIVRQLIQDKISNEYIEDDDKIIYGLVKTIKGKKIYGLFKRKCDITLDKYVIVDNCEYNLSCDTSCQVQPPAQVKTKPTVPEKSSCGSRCTPNQQYSLRKIMKDILENIIKIQNKGYVHCDIKADNIMICGGNATIIDWDLAIKHNDENDYKNPTFCTKRYHGSSTHQSPLITEILYKNCPDKTKARLSEKFKMSAAKFAKMRNIPKDHNLILQKTKDYFKENLKNLIKFHIDLYSISHVLYELCRNTKLYEKMKKDNDFMTVISILQNTKYIDIKDEQGSVNAEKSKFYYNSFASNDDNNNITLTELLKKIDEKYYIVTKDSLDKYISNVLIYKQKYLKYKQKYLELKKLTK